MITEQMYGQTTPDANPVSSIEATAENEELTAISRREAYLNGTVIHNRFSDSPPLTIRSNCFIDNAASVRYMTDMRTAVRSWFCTWIPEDVREAPHGPSAEDGAQMFQDLDEFLGDLIESGHKQELAQYEQQIEEYKQRDTQRSQQYADLTAHVSETIEMSRQYREEIQKACIEKGITLPGQ